MVEVRHRLVRVPGRGLPAALAAVALTVGCSPGGDALPAQPATDATAPAAADPTPSEPAGSDPTTDAPATDAPATDAARNAAVATADVDTAAVLAALDAAASGAGGTLAAVVLDAAGTELVATPDADEPRYTASLAKLLVVQQLLARDTAGLLALTEEDTAWMRRALTVSDDRAMSLLWDRWGGAELVTTAADQFGLTGTRLPSEPGQWGEAVTTARDQATFLSSLGSQLAPEDVATMIAWLQGATDRAADGFAQDFGLLAPTAGTVDPVAAKQGWMCCVDSRRQLHSVGVLADGRVVVLLGDFPTGTSWTRARAALDAAAQAVVTGT